MEKNVVGSKPEKAEGGAKRSAARRATQTIVLTAAFIAVATVANAYLTVRIGSLFKISVLLIVYFYAGYYLGAPIGFLVGVSSDLFGLLLFPDGALNPLILLSNGLSCALPALFFGFKRPLEKQPTLRAFALKAACGYFVCYLVCTVLLTSVGIWLYTTYIVSKYGTLFSWIVYRAGVQSVNTAVNYALTVALYVPLGKIEFFKKN